MYNTWCSKINFLYGGKSMKKAFTLIELLVVVLIIGILAAVALPQYEVSVLKTKLSNMRTVARSYARAAQAYYAENNTWPTTFAAMAMDVPGGNEQINATYHNSCYTTEQMWCCIIEFWTGNQGAGITCGNPDYQFAYEYKFAESGRETCHAKSDNTKAIQMCKSITGNTNAYSTNLASPIGFQAGYNYYSF